MLLEPAVGGANDRIGFDARLEYEYRVDPLVGPVRHPDDS